MTSSSSYQDQRLFFNQLIYSHHWDYAKENLSKLLKENNQQKNINGFIATHLLKFKNHLIWDVYDVSNRFLALISCSQQCFLLRDERVVQQFNIDAEISFASLIVDSGLYVVIGDKRGNIYYFYLSDSYSILFSMKFPADGVADPVKKLLPIYVKGFAPLYMWAVFGNKVLLLHVSEAENLMKTIVQYTVPSRSKLLFAEGKSTIHHNNGLLALHFTNSGKDLLLQILDSAAAILFNEKPHTDRRRAFESLKSPLTVETVFQSPYRSSSADEEIIFSTIGSVLPDNCPNYSSTGEAISHLPFSLKCHVIGARGSISVISHQSAESVVKQTLLRLTSSHLLNFEALSRNDKLISVHPVLTIDYFSSSGHSHQKNLFDHSDKERKFHLWEIMSKLSLATPARKAFLLDLWKDSEYDILSDDGNNLSNSLSRSDFERNDCRQIIFLEGILGINLVKCLQDAILNPIEINYDSHYLIEETQRLFQWICGNNSLFAGKLPSIRENLQSTLHPLLVDRVFIYLINKHSWNHSNLLQRRPQVPLTITLDLLNMTQLAKSYLILTQSLFQRKLILIADALKLTSLTNSANSFLQTSVLGGTNSFATRNSFKSSSSHLQDKKHTNLQKIDQMMKVELTDDFEGSSMIELFLVAYEARVVHDLLMVYHYLCQNPSFNLSFFFPTLLQPKISSMFLSQSHQQLPSSDAFAPFVTLKNTLTHMFSTEGHLTHELPTDFNGQSFLFFELLSLLTFPNEVNRMKKFFDNLSGYCQSLRTPFNSPENEEFVERLETEFLHFFLLPFLLVKRYAESIIQELRYYKQTITRMKELLDEQLLYMKYVLVYFLLFVFSLRSEGENEPGSSSSWRRGKEFQEQLAQLFGLDKREVEIIDLFRFLDSNPVRREDNDVLSSSIDLSVLCSSYGIDFLSKYHFIEPFLKKLLSLNHPRAAYDFMQSLLSQNHPYLFTRNGVIAFALSIPSKKTWELHWQEARTLSERLSPTDSLQATSEITSFMCRWCLRSKSADFHPFGIFLNKDFNFAESEEIIKFLLQRAQEDIDSRKSPSPAVDSLFGFFLKLLRVKEAKALHEDHAMATKHVSAVEAVQSVHYRTRILQLTSQVTNISPVDYQFVLNMNRMNQIN